MIGKPIINSYSGKNDPFVKYDCGLNVPAQNVTELVRAINKVYKMPERDRQNMGSKGTQAALEHYEYSNLASYLSKILEQQRNG